MNQETFTYSYCAKQKLTPRILELTAELADQKI